MVFLVYKCVDYFLEEIINFFYFCKVGYKRVVGVFRNNLYTKIRDFSGNFFYYFGKYSIKSWRDDRERLLRFLYIFYFVIELFY